MTVNENDNIFITSYKVAVHSPFSEKFTRTYYPLEDENILSVRISVYPSNGNSKIHKFLQITVVEKIVEDRLQIYNQAVNSLAYISKIINNCLINSGPK
jgi:hypothetical protein